MSAESPSENAECKSPSRVPRTAAWIFLVSVLVLLALQIINGQRQGGGWSDSAILGYIVGGFLIRFLGYSLILGVIAFVVGLACRSVKRMGAWVFSILFAAAVLVDLGVNIWDWTVAEPRFRQLWGDIQGQSTANGTEISKRWNKTLQGEQRDYRLRTEALDLSAMLDPQVLSDPKRIDDNLAKLKAHLLFVDEWSARQSTNLASYYSELETACRFSPGLSDFRKHWSIFSTNHTQVVFHDKKQILLGMGVLQFVKENKTAIHFASDQLTSEDDAVVKRINDLFGQLEASAKEQEVVRVEGTTAFLKALAALETPR